MTRTRISKANRKQFDPLLKSLLIHGLKNDFAREVVITAIEKGWREARLLLQSQGWEPITLFVMGERRVSLRRISDNKRG